MNKTIYLLIFVVCTGLISCKKSYSCDCTTTVTFAGKDPHQSMSSHPIGQKTSADQASAICKATEAELTEHFKQQLSDPKVSASSSAACAVK